jgi:hypothetical protein
MLMYSVNKRHKHYRHKPTANFSCFQKSTYYAGIRILNNLLFALKSHMNGKAWFQIALKWYTRLFYSLDEYSLSKTDSSILRLCKQHKLTVFMYKSGCFFNSIIYNHYFLVWKLQLYCTYVFVSIWRIPHPTVISTNPGSRECIII